MKRLFEWHFIVKRFPCIGDENRRNQQGVANDEDRRCRIPSRITTCLERGADAARRERTGIRFLLHKELAFKLFHHTTLSIVLHKAIMLLSCTFSQGLEPVRIMCDSILNRPFLDALSHLISDSTVKWCTIINHVTHLLIHLRGQILSHLLPIEDILAKILTRTFRWLLHIHRSTFERLIYHFESKSCSHKLMSFLLFGCKVITF